MPYYTTKGVRLDVYIKDSDRIFDIEMQSRGFDAIGKRMRYYQSMLDIDDLMKGADYSELKESWVIFICKTSPFENFDLPLYSFKECCLENPDIDLADKSHKLIYNASAYEEENDEELKAFLRFICSGDASDSFTDRINALIKQAKQAEANKTEYMGMNLHDRDIRMEGKIEGALEKAVETARKFLLMGLSVSQVAEGTSLPIEKVQSLQSELQYSAQSSNNSIAAQL